MHSEVSFAQDEQLEGHGSVIGVTHEPFSKTCSESQAQLPALKVKEDLQAVHSDVSFEQDEQLEGHGSLTGVAQESFNKICAELHAQSPALKVKEDLH